MAAQHQRQLDTKHCDVSVEARRLTALRKHCAAFSEVKGKSSLHSRSGGWSNATRETSAYDGRCWAIKAAYNCMADGRSPKADQWKWVADLRAGAASCELPTLSPACTARLFSRYQQREPASVSSRRGSLRAMTTTSVLMLGDSQVRQIFEAILCRFGGEITGGVRLTSDSAIGADLKHHTRFLRSEWSAGRLVPILDARGLPKQCNGGDQRWVDSFYPTDALPPRMPDGSCVLNVARVDFGTFRIGFVFRPEHLYARTNGSIVAGSELPLLLDRIGMPPHQVDVILFGGPKQGTLSGSRTEALKYHAKMSLFPASTWLLDFREFLVTLRFQQVSQRVLAWTFGFSGSVIPVSWRWYCARNAMQVTKQRQLNHMPSCENAQGDAAARCAAVCDGTHGCQPGVADDVAKALFFAIAHRLQVL